MDATDDGLAARAGARVSNDQMKELGLSPREIRELVEKVRAPVRPDFELELSVMRSADEMAAEMYQAVPGNFE